MKFIFSFLLFIHFVTQKFWHHLSKLVLYIELIFVLGLRELLNYVLTQKLCKAIYTVKCKTKCVFKYPFATKLELQQMN